MTLRVEIWDDNLDTNIDIQINPYLNGRYDYHYLYIRYDESHAGYGEIFSPHEMNPLEITNLITTSILEKIYRGSS